MPNTDRPVDPNRPMIDRLRTIAEGPALDLPPVAWEAPLEVSDRLVVRWGVLPWEVAAIDWVPNVYLCAYDTPGLNPFIEFGEQSFTPAEARIVLDRLASAIAMAEEVTR